MAARNVDYQTGLVLSNNYYSKRNNYSNISQEICWRLVEKLGESGIYFKSLNYEYQIVGKNLDFYDSVSNIAIEFNGDYWHANPIKYKATDVVMEIKQQTIFGIMT